MKKTVKPEVAVEVRQRDCLPLTGLWGLGVAFVVAGSGYTAYIVFLSTTNWTVRLAAVPQILFSSIVLLWKFSR